MLNENNVADKTERIKPLKQTKHRTNKYLRFTVHVLRTCIVRVPIELPRSNEAPLFSYVLTVSSVFNIDLISQFLDRFY